MGMLSLSRPYWEVGPPGRLPLPLVFPYPDAPFPRLAKAPDLLVGGNLFIGFFARGLLDLGKLCGSVRPR